MERSGSYALSYRSREVFRIAPKRPATQSVPPLPPLVPAVSENFLIAANSSLESGYLTAMSGPVYRYGAAWRRIA
jgi:hypothetical protein